MDVHFMEPLLNFLSTTKLYDEDSINRQRLECLKHTAKVNEEKALAKSLNTSVSREYTDIRESLKSKCSKFVQAIDSKRPLTEKMTKSFAQEHYDLTDDSLSSFYDYAKAQYEVGQYEDSDYYLSVYQDLVVPTSTEYLNATWGKLASCIMQSNWKVATSELLNLSEAIENNHSVSSIFLKLNLHLYNFNDGYKV